MMHIICIIYSFGMVTCLDVGSIHLFACIAPQKQAKEQKYKKKEETIIDSLHV